MNIPRHITIVLFGLAAACGDDSSAEPGDTSSTGADTTGGPSSSGDPTTNATQTTSPPETGPADTTVGPVTDCERTIRHPLFDGQACGRLLVGDIDADGFEDVIAFGRAADAGDGPVPTSMQTFVGGNIGLDNGEVHCCLDATPTGAAVVFDINGDGRGDPLWASERAIDGGALAPTFEKSIRNPEHGYVRDGVLYTATTNPIAFTVGRITPQVFGVIAVVDDTLLSLEGNGDGLGLVPFNTHVLDPVPTVWSINTIEIDGQAGVDVVGVGPDGLLVWGGTVEGTFADATVTELPGTYTHVESIDLDLDGNRQLVLFGDGEPVAVVEGDGDGGVVISTTGTPTVPPPATVIEVDGDLEPDIVAVEGGNLVMYPGDGESFGDASVLAPIGETTDIAYGDFDGDGRSDVVACDDQGILVIYRADR